MEVVPGSSWTGFVSDWIVTWFVEDHDRATEASPEVDIPQHGRVGEGVLAGRQDDRPATGSPGHLYEEPQHGRGIVAGPEVASQVIEAGLVGGDVLLHNEIITVGHE